MYEVEIVIHRRTAAPFRVTQVRAETRVKEICESFLGAWGLPVPATLRDDGLSLFAERLAEAGVYRHDEADYLIAVKRST